MIFTGMVPHSEVADYYRLGDLFVTASTSDKISVLAAAGTEIF